MEDSKDPAVFSNDFPRWNSLSLIWCLWKNHFECPFLEKSIFQGQCGIFWLLGDVGDKVLVTIIVSKCWWHNHIVGNVFATGR